MHSRLARSISPLCLAVLWALAALVLPQGAAVGDEPASATFKHGSWPFRPPERPQLPELVGKSGASAIDALVMRELNAKGLVLSPPADKLTLLRRVSLDLTGLPPAVAEQDAFLADTSPEAYDHVVDRLLASPRYGERWAQHWLDLVRYAETDGFKSDDYRPNAYKYRDYVIQALNDDMPYDRFVQQQLAGDELEPGNPQALVATGLLRHWPEETNAANLEQRRQEILDDITENTGLTFLGLTIGCAQCHDHKFDEIAQADYFRMQAFFAAVAPRDDLSTAPAEEKAEHDRREQAYQDATQAVRAKIDALLAGPRAKQLEYNLQKFRKEIQDTVAKPADKRTPYEQHIADMAMREAHPKDEDAEKKLNDAQKRELKQLREELKPLAAQRPAPLPTAMAATDLAPTAPPTFVLAGGNWRKPLDEVQPGFLPMLGDPTANVTTSSSAPTSTGRRSALARWLTRPDHPLTSRVIANRLWQHHFGEGIVASPNDFGAQGEPPTNPQLLDWLAVELTEHHWSLKHLQRVMVTSAVYRQSSQVDTARPEHQAGMRIDPQDRLLWHARRVRLEGEPLRDSMLATSGELNLRMFGPSAKPALPDGISKSYAWQPDAQLEDQHRRSIYVFAKRNLRYPLLDAFDLPDMHHSCGRRALTITAPQGLLLLNGEESLDLARRWATRLWESSGHDEAAAIRLAYRQAYARTADDAEVSAAREFLSSQAAVRESASHTSAAPAEKDGLSPARAAALVDFCHAIFNSNEFLYID